MTISERFDGINFALHRGRFSGSVDLEETEAAAAAMGETLVMVVVANVADVGAKLDKNGDLIRIPVFKATDARILDTELKQLLVERLGLYGADTVEPVRIVPQADTAHHSMQSVDFPPSYTYNAEDGEVPAWSPTVKVDEGDQMSFGDVEDSTIEVLGHIQDFQTTSVSGSAHQVQGPRVGDLRPEVTLGRVGGNEAWRGIDG